MAYSNRGSSSGSRPQQGTQQQRPQQQTTPPPAGAGNQAPVVFDPRKQKLFERFSTKFGIDPDLLVATMKATCFRGQKTDAPPITNEQLAMLLIVADQYNLNPFTKEIYAYPDKAGGIVAVVSVDGWIRIINEHEQFNGMTIVESEAVITDNSDRKHKHKPCFEWMECTIFRKDREHHLPIKEYFDEVYRQSLNVKGNDGSWYEVQTPWQTHTKRLMRHKTIIQSGRVTFGFAGIYDEEEAQRILDDDSVVATIPKDRPATHVAAAKDALRQHATRTAHESLHEKGQAAATPADSAAAANSTPGAGAKAAQQQAPDLGRKAGQPNPWDDEKGTVQKEKDAAKEWPPFKEKERWISSILTAKTAKETQEIWTAYLDAGASIEAEELDIDIESNYQYRMEQFEQNQEK